MYVLNDHNHDFPDPRRIPDDLIAIGGDLDPDRVLKGYRLGIFPWPHEDLPLLWFCPQRRMVLEPSKVHISRSMRRVLRRGDFEIKLDTDFDAIVHACATAKRATEYDTDGTPEPPGTWISEGIKRTYSILFERGHAHCIGVYRDGKLIGGMYGVGVGTSFTGESMFSFETNASKIAFITMARQLEAWGYEIFDAQMYTPHLASLGAMERKREFYLSWLTSMSYQTPQPSPWRLTIDPTDIP